MEEEQSGKGRLLGSSIGTTTTTTRREVRAIESADEKEARREKLCRENAKRRELDEQWGA